MEETKMQNIPMNVWEMYLKVQKMLKEHQSMDNSKDPYEKKYEVIRILQETVELTIQITSLMETKDKTVMLVISYLTLGILHSDTEDTKAAEEQFTKCINLSKDKELEPEFILPVTCALNQVAILYVRWGEPTKAKVLLQKAEKLYIEYTENVQLEPIDMTLTLGLENTKQALSPSNLLKKIHMLTLYYLAQVYSISDDELFATYCHRTLSKQLSQDKTTHDLDYIDWALNAATFSQYFIEKDNFPQARYHLAAASYILQKYQEALEAKGPKETSEIIAAEYENYNYRSADIARCWAKYGITLLSSSKERLLKEVEMEDECSSNDVTESTTESPKSGIELRFDDIEPELEAIASQVTDQFLLVFDDARPVFLNIRKWLDKAKTYYTLDTHASDYARIAQDISQAFRYLSFYEEREDRQAKMHKRRIDVLEAVVKELNPQYYRAICQEIWIELGEAYSEILDIKIAARSQTPNEKSSVHAVKKINNLAKSSITHFRSYLDSLETRKSGNGEKSFLDDQLYQALYTNFLIGRLYGKMITSVLQQEIENTQECFNAYNFIVTYYEKHPEKEEELKKHEFVSVSKGFVELLPHTLKRLKQQLILQ